MPAPSASARCTSSLLTPTRKPPPISLLRRKRPAPSSSSQYEATRAACSSGARPRSGQQALLDPLGQAEVALVRRRRQHVRDGLGEIADRLVAGVEQPVVDAGAAAGDRPQHAARHDLARLAAGEKVHRPGRVARRGVGEVALQRIDLGKRGGARVELGEERGRSASCGASPRGGTGADGSARSSSLSPYSVSKALASRPCSPSQRTITAS